MADALTQIRVRAFDPSRFIPDDALAQPIAASTAPMPGFVGVKQAERGVPLFTEEEEASNAAYEASQHEQNVRAIQEELRRAPASMRPVLEQELASLQVIPRMPLQQVQAQPVKSVPFDPSKFVPDQPTQRFSGALLAQPQRPPAGPVDPGAMSLGDVPLALGLGVNRIVEAAGQGIKFLGGEEIGKAIRDIGRDGQDYFLQGMSPGGKASATAESFSEHPLSVIMMAAVTGVPELAAMAVPVGGEVALANRLLWARRIAKRLQQGGVSAKRAEQIGQVGPTALAAGASEGTYTGLSNAAAVAQEIAEMDWATLEKHPFAQDLLRRLPADMPQEQREKMVRQGVSEAAERWVATRTATWTGTIGALTGGGVLGMIGRPSGGVFRGVTRGGVSEARQEAPQSAGEQAISNIGAQRFFDEERSTFEGVPEAAIIGAGAGGILGGAAGGVHALVAPDVEAGRDKVELQRILRGEPPAAPPAAPPPAAAPEIATAPAVPVPSFLTPSTPTDIAAAQAATSPLNERRQPTQGQKEAGNYKVGRVQFQGLPISIETPKGAMRTGEGWQVIMPAHYGYIRGTKGKDKDHVDAYLGPSEQAPMAFVIDQIVPETGAFDEHKVMLGYDSIEEAQAAYEAGFSDGRATQRIGAISALPIKELKAWLRDRAATKKPLRYEQPKPVEEPPPVEVEPQPQAPVLVEPELRAPEPAQPPVPLPPIETQPPAAIGGLITDVLAEADAEIAAASQAGIVLPAERPTDIFAEADAEIARAQESLLKEADEEIARAEQPPTEEKPSAPETREEPEGREPEHPRDDEGVRPGRGREDRQRPVRQPAAREERGERGRAQQGEEQREGVAQPVSAPPTEEEKPEVKKRQRKPRKYREQAPRLLKLIKELGGLKSGLSLDLIGKRAHVTNRRLPGLFKSGGKNLDEIVEGLNNRGWFTPGQLEDVDGGVQLLRDMIRTAFEGGQVFMPGEHEAFADAVRAADDENTILEHDPVAVAEELVSEGLADPTVGDVLDYELIAAARELDEAAVEAIPDQIDDAAYMARIQEIADGKRQTEEGDRGVERREETAQEEALLERPTTEEIQAREARVKQAAEAQRQREEQLERKEKADAQRASFELTGSERTADIPGQGNLLEPQLVTYEVPTRIRVSRARSPGGPAARTATGAVSLDLFSPSNLEHTAEQAAGRIARFATDVAQIRVGTFRSGVERVETPEDAAHVFAPLRKSAVEQFFTLVLDKAKRPLAVIQGGIGNKTQTSVFPGMVAEAAHSIPGAHTVWVAHNHPSGLAEPSRADEVITIAIDKVLSGTGIELAGHIVVAKNVAWWFEGATPTGVVNIKPLARRFEIPRLEQRFARRGAIWKDAISSPAEAKRAIAEISGGNEGVLFLNQQQWPTAWVPMSADRMRRLRTGEVGAGASLLHQAAARANATSMMAYINERKSIFAVQNLGSWGVLNDVRLLDAFWPEGESLQSAAQRGEPLTGSDINLSRQGGIPLFSRLSPNDDILSAFPTGGMAPQLLERYVRRITGRWAQPLDVRVAKSAAEMRKQTGATKDQIPDDTNGVHWGGTIWLIADNIGSAKKAKVILAHEAIGHYGMEAVLGERFPGLVKKVRAWKAAGVKPILELYADVKRTHGELKPDQAAKEVIARIAERQATLPGALRALWDQIVTAVKQFLRERLFINLEFSPTELRALVRAVGRYIETGEGFAPAAVRAMGGDINLARAIQAGSRASWDATEPSRLDAFIRVLQDKHIDTKRVLQAIRNASGAIDDALDVYLQEELFHGRTAKTVQDFLDTELKPLLANMVRLQVTIPQFEEYLHARHAEERNAQIAAINPDLPDGGSGMPTQAARDYLAGLEQGKRNAFEALAVQVDAINSKTRQELIAYGLESPDTIQTWEGVYEHYVPLHRDDMEGGPGTGQGFSVRGPATKRAMGSRRQVVDILANIAMQRERTIVRGEKNRVANALVGLAQAHPNPDFWKVDRPPKLKVIDERTGLVAQRTDPLYKSRENVIVARMPNEEGRIVEHSVVFNQHDERAARMVEALKNLDAHDLGEVLSASAKITRYFASINTQYNPIFGIVNLTRDTQGALLNLTSTAIPGKQIEVLRYTVDALRGIYADLRAARAGEQPRSAWAQLWDEFQKEGGQTGYRDMFRTSKDRAEAIEREIKRVTEGKAKHFGRVMFDWLSDYNSAMENAVRLAAYKVAKESGLSNQRAASLAKNLTVNFNRKGQIGIQAGALYAFFNASVQGTARLVETLQGPAGRKIILGGLVLGSLQAIALATAGFDEDEPPDFVRERSLIIPIGGKRYITIPMPLGLHIIPNLGRIPTEYVLSGFRDAPKRIAQFLDVFVDAFNPVGNAGLSLQTIAPTAIDPIAALAENKDWTGKPIAREDFRKLSPTPGHLRAKDTASEFSKATSRALNWLSGGTEYQPGMFSPTPDQIDYLIGQAAGGLGREAMKVEQTITSAITGEELPTYKIPLIGRFYGSAQGQGPQANAYYTNLRAINMHEAEIKGRRSAGERVDAYIRAHPETNLIKYADRIEREVMNLRKRRRELIQKGAQRSQIREVEARITATMRRLNEAVRRLREREAA